jgi:hypothetical protein
VRPLQNWNHAIFDTLLFAGVENTDTINVADQFIVGVMELGEWHNQKHEAEYCKPKTQIQTSNKTWPR